MFYCLLDGATRILKRLPLTEMLAKSDINAKPRCLQAYTLFMRHEIENF